MQNAVNLHQSSEQFNELSPSPYAAPQYRLDSLSDTQLIDRCRQNDHAAFDVLIGRYERRIYRLAYRLSRNRDVAQGRSGRGALSHLPIRRQASRHKYDAPVDKSNRL